MKIKIMHMLLSAAALLLAPAAHGEMHCQNSGKHAILSSSDDGNRLEMIDTAAQFTVRGNGWGGQA